MPVRLLLASAVFAVVAPCQAPRLVDSVAAPIAYLSLAGDSPGADSMGGGGAAGTSPRGNAPGAGAVRKLIADPAFDVLFAGPSGAEANGSEAAPGARELSGVGTTGRALALVRGVLARSSGELEVALTSIVPADGLPLLVVRAQLRAGAADQMRTLLDGNTVATPMRTLGGRQTYRLAPAGGRLAQAGGQTPNDGPGRTVEVALVGDDLVIGNDGWAMQELLEPAPATTSAQTRGVLAADPRFVAVRRRLDLPPGSLFVYGDWQRLGRRLQTADDGVSAQLLAASGLESARAMMASVAAANDGFTVTMLFDFDVPPEPAAPAPNGPRGPGRAGDGVGIDGWFAAMQPVAAKSLLGELPVGGFGGLVLAVDLAQVAQRSSRGAFLMHELAETLDHYGLDFERNVVGRLGTRGTVQLLFRRGATADAPPEVFSVYAMRAKSRKAASDLFADLRRSVEQRGMGRTIAGKDKQRGPEVLELRWGAAGRPGHEVAEAQPCLTVLDDFVLLAFDSETLFEVHEEHAAHARTRRDPAIARAVQTIGGENVAGLFDVDLQPLFAHLAEVIGVGAGGTKVDLSGLPKRHTGFLDLQKHDAGVLLRVCVLSARQP